MTSDTLQATAFAPASIGNVGVGFDILGLAISGAGDTVTIRRTSAPTVHIEAILGADVPLPKDPAKNTATAGLMRLIEDKALDFGFALTIRKGIAMGSGMGGSAASAAAALKAASGLLSSCGITLSDQELFDYALIGEAVASGAAHGDNLAPALFGGLQLVTGHDPIRRRRIPTPKGLSCALVHPHMQLETRQARAVLARPYALNTIVAQSERLAEFLAGCYSDDLEAIAASLGDELIEPLRAPLIPGFYQVKEAALSLGALGCTISGAGPSVFAWCRDEAQALTCALAMQRAFADHANLESDLFISPLDAPGATLIHDESSP